MEPLVFSHFTLVTPLGAGQAKNLAALREGQSGLAACRFETVDIPTYVGEVMGLDEALPEAFARFDCRNNRLARAALAQDGFAETVAAAIGRYGSDRVALVLGTSTSGIHETERGYRHRDSKTGALPARFDYAGSHNTFSVAAFLARYLGVEGPATSISAACATTAKAFASAARMIRSGLCDAAIVGGADSLCLTTLYGFRSLELTAEGPCRPFDADRTGLSIGEAAGFALIEKKNANPHTDPVLLLGTGESSDAYHMSSPHPDGEGARLAMERALASANLAPEAIEYVNLHGTATMVGDAAEDRAIVSLFGTQTPCSSTKGHTGHALGAAGIVEIIISALALRHGFTPGSPHTRKVDSKLRCNYVLEPTPARLDRVMSNSFGFGGNNCSVILGRG